MCSHLRSLAWQCDVLTTADIEGIRRLSVATPAASAVGEGRSGGHGSGGAGARRSCEAVEENEAFGGSEGRVEGRDIEGLKRELHTGLRQACV